MHWLIYDKYQFWRWRKSDHTTVIDIKAGWQAQTWAIPPCGPHASNSKNSSPTVHPRIREKFTPVSVTTGKIA